MITNPYVVAAGRQLQRQVAAGRQLQRQVAAGRQLQRQVAAGHLRGSTTPAVPALPERVEAFFDAMSIMGGNNRARVLTAIANTMTAAELADANTRLLADRASSVDELRRLQAPDCLITNAERKHAMAIGILARVQRRRAGG